MKYLNEFIDYLKEEGYEDKYLDSVDGYLCKVDCFYCDKQVTFSVEATKEFEEFIKNKVKENGSFEYDIDYKNYIVKAISMELPITAYDAEESETVYLTSNKNEYHQHGLDLLEKCVYLQKHGFIEHEMFISQKHIEHLKWAKDVLIPVLEKADYTIEYSSVFDISHMKCDSNLTILFKHYNDKNFIEQPMYMGTDCLTGECVFPNNMQLFGKGKEEVWNILVEELWKKANITKRFSYLYTEGETKETFSQYLLNFKEQHYDTKLQKSV